RNGNAHHAHFESGDDGRVLDGSGIVFAEEAAHPGDAFAAHDVIRVHHVADSGNRCDVSADDDGGLRPNLANALAHLPHLADVGDDGGDADNVVFLLVQFLLELLESGEVEHRAGRGDVALDHHDPPRAVEHAQREAALSPGYLVVVELHRIDGTA